VGLPFKKKTIKGVVITHSNAFFVTFIKGKPSMVAGHFFL